MTTTLPFQKPTEIDSRRIRVSLIDIPPEYEGKDALVEDDALRKSIEKEGVHQSVMLIPNGNRFTLVRGTRRVRISQLVGIPDIPAVVNFPPTGSDEKAYRDKLRMVLKQTEQNLLPSQRAELIKQLMKVYGLNQKEIAAALGFDAGSVTNWMSVTRYAKPILEAIDSGEITLHHARSFDGMKPRGQIKVWNELRDDFKALPGGKMHKRVRRLYHPEKYPELYVAPAKTAEKLKRRSSKRSRLIAARTPLSTTEKRKLLASFEMQEIELADAKQELLELKKQITLATQPIRGILRNKDLLELIPEEMREELERFGEVYC